MTWQLQLWERWDAREEGTRPGHCDYREWPPLNDRLGNKRLPGSAQRWIQKFSWCPWIKKCAALRGLTFSYSCKRIKEQTRTFYSPCRQQWEREKVRHGKQPIFYEVGYIHHFINSRGFFFLVYKIQHLFGCKCKVFLLHLLWLKKNTNGLTVFHQL